MARNINPNRKYNYSFVLQGHYGESAGWEDLTAEETRKEINGSLRDYRVHEGGTYRVVQRREARNV